jgi:hypothetical protein
MAGRSTAAAEAPEDEAKSVFDLITVETKAGTFEFKEIDGETYDKCVELSTKTKTIGGEERETTDMVLLLRWLAAKSAATKGFDMEKLNKLPFSARQQVLTAVNGLYFPDSVEDLVLQLRMRGYTVTPPPKPAEREPGNS